MFSGFLIIIKGGDDRRRSSSKRLGEWEELPSKDNVREYFEVPEDKTLTIVVGNTHAEEMKKIIGKLNKNTKLQAQKITEQTAVWFNNLLASDLHHSFEKWVGILIQNKKW